MNLRFEKKHIFWIGSLILLALILGSCSTKKNTWTRRVYHNITCRYNVYWNGNESLKSGVAELKKATIDDYSKVLRVFNYGNKSDAQKIYPSMERALEKGAIGVQKHSMVYSGKELVNYIDDSYLMMGKAHFFKQDYISAKRTFDFVANQYNYNDITNTADLWQAINYMQLEQYEKALALLEKLQSKRRSINMSKEVIDKLSLVFADFYIAKGNYANAVPYLKKALEETNSKYFKTRVLFILAQISQLNGEKKKALEYFAAVLKKNPSYDMAFEARINMARSYDASQGDSKQILKELNKMLNDPKNLDYLDKIYFALADIAFAENDEPLAMEYLAKSVSSSTKDKNQLSKSALKLAAILFDKNEYVPSQAYYDTAVSALSKDYPGYDSIRNRSNILSDLVDNISTIYMQDSLLKLANMDSTSRNTIIAGIIEKLVEEERKQAEIDREMERNVMMANQFGDRSNASANTDPSQGWYLYNPTTLSYGYTEFLRKWGRRKLEDNWRISDKQSANFETIESKQLESIGETGGDSAAVVYTDRDKEYYLQDIPLTDEAQIESLKMIEDAFNNLGYIYKESLSDFPRSKEAYIELDERFPESEYQLQAWYALYKMYSDEGSYDQAEHYKQLILGKYPNTDYAKVIEDPDYFISKSKLAGESTLLFEQTFKAYQNEEYYRVLLNANRARTLYPDDVELLPRFDFLRAIAKGRLEVIDSMAVALEQLVKTYPKSSVAPLAASILRNMNKEFNMNIDIPEIEGDSTVLLEEASPYNHVADTKFLLMVITSSEKVKTDPLKVRLSDFNNRDFKSAQLMIKSLVLDEARMLVTVGNFNDAASASDYMSAVKQSGYVFGGINADDFVIWPISLTNYPIFYRLKDTAEYEKFWKKNNTIKP